ncbi:beta-trefoil DNA-binding domain-containing protein [Chlamydoabsidia padenii]|nr:beta-trefoil DNA-binding domain-containing protein [Chlamydoabsidia padenii]
MTTITCYHASVAQKSYGSEKRFLCPPPIVRFQPPTLPTTDGISTPCHLTMAVMEENGDIPLEQQAVLDKEDQCTFKYLHVTGSAKTKKFSLLINISSHTTNAYHSSPSPSPCLSPTDSPSPTDSSLSSPPQSYASFLSKPISIISKPSKKTMRNITRNVTTCVMVNQLVSFYSRINSQTVRTKYMTSDNDQLCAKNTLWSPFEIILLHQPPPQQPTKSNRNVSHQYAAPLVYGSELILKDTRTGTRSQPLIIRKVDRGRIVPDAGGPVSQMQKVALQLVSSSSLYLSASGANDEKGTDQVATLNYATSRMVPDGLDVYERVDDHLCWTIVGISTFEYSFYDKQHATRLPLSSRSITPFPLITSIQYKPSTHTLDILGQHLTQMTMDGSPTLLSLWLGSHHGPLHTTQVGSDKTHLHVDLPCTQDLIVANHDRLVNHGSTYRTLELPLYFVRQDGVVYHSGKSLNCELLVNSDTGRWSITDLRQ